MIAPEARALARLLAVKRGQPMVLRDVADIAPRADAALLALATMPGDGHVWTGCGRAAGGEWRDFSIVEPRNATIERAGLTRLAEFFAELNGAYFGESAGDYPQIVAPDGETTRALELIRARFRADPEPTLRRLSLQIAFCLDTAKLDGADAYVDLRGRLVDHVAWPLAPAEERHLAKLLACLEPDPTTADWLAARRTCIDDDLADELSAELIARSEAIKLQRGRRTVEAIERRALAGLADHAANLRDLLERGLATWSQLGLTEIDSAQTRIVTDDYRYRRARWVADEPPFLPARPRAVAAHHDLLRREAAAQRRAFHLAMLDPTTFAEATLAGEAARATVVERQATRRLAIHIAQPNLRLRHGDPIEARNVPGLRGVLIETPDGPTRHALAIENGVRRAAALHTGDTLELVQRWDGQLAQKRHQCLRLWSAQTDSTATRRRPRPRAADPASWYLERRR